MIKRRHITSVTQEVLDEAFGHDDSPKRLRNARKVVYPMSWESGTRTAHEDNHRKLQLREVISVDHSRNVRMDASKRS